MGSKSTVPDELYADLVLMNGKIITINPDDSVVEAVVCKDKKFVKVGTNEDVKPYIGKSTEVIDLGGKTVVPGFVDTHLHFSSGGRRARFVDLRYVRSMEDLVTEIKKKAEQMPPGRWVQGYGYNESKLKEKRFPNRYDLDKASMDHPISITRQGGHDGIRVNSLALELAGISKDTPDPEPPSFIDRDPELGGLFDAAVRAARRSKMRTEVAGQSVPVVPRDYLIAMKIATMEEKDERDAERLILAVSDDEYGKLRSLVRRHLGPVGALRLDVIARRVGHPGPGRRKYYNQQNGIK